MKVTLLWQENTTLHTFDAEKSNGFVFAPFLHNQPAYVIPNSHSMEYIMGTAALDMEVVANITSSETTSRPHKDIQLATKKHQSLVAAAIKKIKVSEFEKVVLARKESISFELDPMQTLSKLLVRYETAFCYWFFHPELGSWQGATPELLLKLDSSSLQTVSLAGTRKYDPFRSVEWSEKEYHEQRLVTDQMLSRLQGLGLSPVASETFNARAGNLWHLKTNIETYITAHVPLLPLIEALHPSAAICGLPREKALEFIEENEGFDRQFYAGYLGMINHRASAEGQKNTEAELYVNLRCMSIEGTVANVFIGSGITTDSNPLKEWEETVHKAQTMTQVLMG
ncbi:MAG: isochorismate synthase [Flavobacteriaceae bacterium]